VERGSPCLEVISVKNGQHIGIRGDWNMLVGYAGGM
jgi:hypothetical protein